MLLTPLMSQTPFKFFFFLGKKRIFIFSLFCINWDLDSGDVFCPRLFSVRGDLQSPLGITDRATKCKPEPICQCVRECVCVQTGAHLYSLSDARIPSLDADGCQSRWRRPADLKEEEWPGLGQRSSMICLRRSSSSPSFALGANSPSLSPGLTQRGRSLLS